MPGSEKILQNRQRAANRAAGIGDKDGKLSHLQKKAEIMLKCTVCSAEIRATKRNIEAGAHATSKHPTMTFLDCFPGATLPEGADGNKCPPAKAKIDVDKVRSEAAEAKSIAEGGVPKSDKKKNKKKKDDLSAMFAAAGGK